MGLGKKEQKALARLPSRAANDRAKKLLLIVADGYDRLAE
jgi:hypothetical protein